MTELSGKATFLMVVIHEAEFYTQNTCRDTTYHQIDHGEEIDMLRWGECTVLGVLTVPSCLEME